MGSSSQGPGQIAMSNDTKWIIGTVLSTAIALAGLLLAQSSSMNGRMDRLDDRLRAVENRLRVVEIGLAEVKLLISGGRQNQVNVGRGPSVTLPPRGN